MDTSSKGNLHSGVMYPQDPGASIIRSENVDRRTNSELRAALSQAQNIVDTVREPLLLLSRILKKNQRQPACPLLVGVYSCDLLVCEDFLGGVVAQTPVVGGSNTLLPGVMQNELVSTVGSAF